MRAPHLIAEARKIVKLPFVQRILHPKIRRAWVGLGVSVLVMVSASAFAKHAEEVSALVGVHHVGLDALAYLVHGIASFPFVRYAEPLWLVVLGE